MSRSDRGGSDRARPDTPAIRYPHQNIRLIKTTARAAMNANLQSPEPTEPEPFHAERSGHDWRFPNVPGSNLPQNTGNPQTHPRKKSPAEFDRPRFRANDYPELSNANHLIRRFSHPQQQILDPPASEKVSAIHSEPPRRPPQAEAEHHRRTLNEAKHDRTNLNGPNSAFPSQDRRSAIAPAPEKIKPEHAEHCPAGPAPTQPAPA